MTPDAIDLSTVEIHNSPPDIATWPATVPITELTMSPTAGLTFAANVPPAWDYHMPGWGNPAAGDPGNILYTVWTIVKVAAAWHGAGFILMWKGRPATGAPILKQWREWAYARDRWGAMVDYVPKVGDEIGFLLSAGNARNERGVTSLRERSNVVSVRLPAEDTGIFRFEGNELPPPIDPPPAPRPTDVAGLAVLLTQGLNMIDNLTTITRGQVAKTMKLQETVDRLERRVKGGVKGRIAWTGVTHLSPDKLDGDS
jgi:hypothetical protein